MVGLSGCNNVQSSTLQARIQATQDEFTALARERILDDPEYNQRATRNLHVLNQEIEAYKKSHPLALNIEPVDPEMLTLTAHATADASRTLMGP